MELVGGDVLDAPQAFPLRGRWHGAAVTDEVLPEAK